MTESELVDWITALIESGELTDEESQTMGRALAIMERELERRYDAMRGVSR